jgi:ribonuclease VapC
MVRRTCDPRQLGHCGGSTRRDDRASIEDKLGEAAVCRVGAPTLLETAMVLTSRTGLAGRSPLGRFLQEKGVEVIDSTAEHWGVVRGAFGRFGRGRHPAVLNFGDCMPYGIALVANEPLLHTGDGFPRTDLKFVE